MEATRSPDPSGARFSAEVERVRVSGTLGASGRLRELFDFLAARGEAAEPVSQAEISEAVFGQSDSAGDDATVRVYIHRLRKRLEDFYAGQEEGRGKLTIPAGTYALRLAQEEPEEPLAPAPQAQPEQPAGKRPIVAIALALAALVVIGAFLLGRSAASGTAPVNAMWEPFLESDRPIMVVVGDYYIFGEIDPVRPEEGRLIRDFSINSPTDLARAQETEPERYGYAEDVGLNYLPFSSAYGLHALMPILAQHEQPVEVIPASAVDSDTLRNFNVVYIGLLSGMSLLEDINFMQSGYALGPSYDELIDLQGEQGYVSEEARQLASARYYRDYGYVSQFRAPGGALVAVVAGARDTGLRAIAPVVARRNLPEPLAELAEAPEPPGFEALFEITGQQGADLSQRLVTARPRPQTAVQSPGR